MSEANLPVSSPIKKKVLCKPTVYVFCYRVIPVRKRVLSSPVTAKPSGSISWLCHSFAYQTEHLLICQTTNHSAVSKLRSLVANFNITQLFQFVRALETSYKTEHRGHQRQIASTICGENSAEGIDLFSSGEGIVKYAALRME